MIALAVATVYLSQFWLSTQKVLQNMGKPSMYQVAQSMKAAVILVVIAMMATLESAVRVVGVFREDCSKPSR